MYVFCSLLRRQRTKLCSYDLASQIREGISLLVWGNKQRQEDLHTWAPLILLKPDQVAVVSTSQEVSVR